MLESLLGLKKDFGEAGEGGPQHFNRTGDAVFYIFLL